MGMNTLKMRRKLKVLKETITLCLCLSECESVCTDWTHLGVLPPKVDCNQEGGFLSMRIIPCAMDGWLFSQIWGNVGNAISDIKGVAFVLSPGSLSQCLTRVTWQTSASVP